MYEILNFFGGDGVTIGSMQKASGKMVLIAAAVAFVLFFVIRIFFNVKPARLFGALSLFVLGVAVMFFYFSFGIEPIASIIIAVAVVVLGIIVLKLFF